MATYGYAENTRNFVCSISFKFNTAHTSSGQSVRDKHYADGTSLEHSFNLLQTKLHFGYKKIF